MPYQDRTYPVHRYEGDGLTAETDAKIFGSGFVLLSHWSDDGTGSSGTSRTILIDPSDIEKLELALKEAKRRRNSSVRRRRRKLEQERMSA
jgi:hypothetical protein